jgi:hypothetical protein
MNYFTDLIQHHAIVPLQCRGILVQMKSYRPMVIRRITGKMAMSS